MPRLTERERVLLAETPRQLFIAGQWTAGATDAEFPVEDPATGQVLTTVADASPADGLAALTAASEAQAAWGETPPRERADILRRVHDTMMERRDDLALLVTLEMGKPLVEADTEVVYAAQFFRWYAEEAVRVNGRYTRSETGSSRILTMRHPVGPCLFITPWNFPLAMGTRKIAPALAAGCTCVVKPASQTPLSMLALAAILHQAGVPGSVVNVVTSKNSASLVTPLIQDPRLRKLSFTGSTEVGQHLTRQTTDQLLRVSMELGGNAPFIVFADADMDAAVEGAVVAKMRNGGEACTSANRFYVHESIREEFSHRLATRLGSIQLGRGTEASAQSGPLIDDAQLSRVKELVDEAVSQGARVLCGGKVATGPGHFFEPTVLTDLAPDARILSEEIFGPVAPVVGFQSDADVVAAANASKYGLAAYIFTTNFERAFAVSEALETGMVALNQGTISNVAAPFGGVKHSGVGREGGPEGIEEYLELKYLALPAGRLSD